MDGDERRIVELERKVALLLRLIRPQAKVRILLDGEKQSGVRCADDSDRVVMLSVAEAALPHYRPGERERCHCTLELVTLGNVLVGDLRCRACGCTEDAACDPPCYWVETDLCSLCGPAQ